VKQGRFISDRTLEVAPPDGPIAGRIHDEIWPILERYTQRVDDPSLRPPDARAARVFFFTGVSLR
jgi:hypothetical protein